MAAGGFTGALGPPAGGLAATCELSLQNAGAAVAAEGRRQGRRRHPGAGAGEAGIIAATISSPAAAGTAAGSGRPACAWVLQGPAGRGFWGARRGGADGDEDEDEENRARAGASGRSRAPALRGGEAGQARPRPASGRSSLGGPHHPAAGPSSKSHRGRGCRGQTDATATRQARGQPPQPPSHAGSGHRGRW